VTLGCSNIVDGERVFEQERTIGAIVRGAGRRLDLTREILQVDDGRRSGVGSPRQRSGCEGAPVR